MSKPTTELDAPAVKHSGCADPENCVGCVTAPGTRYEGHTPGPWSFSGTRIFVCNAAADCEIGTALRYPDAALIIAAPNLHGFVRAARRVLPRILEESDEIDDCIRTGHSQEVLDEIEELLAHPV